MNPDAYQVVALTGGQKYRSAGQGAAREFGAEIAVTAHEDRLNYAEIGPVRNRHTEAAAGEAALIEAANPPADWIMSAIVGAAGLPPGLKALEQGTTLALGQQGKPCHRRSACCLATAQTTRHGHHPARRQRTFRRVPGAEWRRHRTRSNAIIITASGGAFRDWPLEDLAKRHTRAGLEPSELGHGPKRITIDSASMFNKALELIETREFFGVDPEPDRNRHPPRKPDPRAGRLPRQGPDRPCRPATICGTPSAMRLATPTGPICRWKRWILTENRPIHLPRPRSRALSGLGRSPARHGNPRPGRCRLQRGQGSGP